MTFDAIKKPLHIIRMAPNKEIKYSNTFNILLA